jgi:Zn-dependent peptidase ImmA (M78 family)
MPLSYHHPGHAFLAEYGRLQSEEDILRYVEFLRQASGLSDRPPIELHPIFERFGMPTPIRAPLDQQQGILVDSGSGLILIKEDDPLVRQRFTEGHELLELLFDAVDELRRASYLPSWSEAHKEKLCDRGAAELLMPQTSFVPHLQTLGLSLATGRSLATLYQTSRLATLIRMVQLGSGDCAIVLWHVANKPSEIQARHTSQPKPAQKLRVWWRIQTTDWTGGFIPKDKSISDASLIRQVHRTGRSLQGHEIIHWGSTRQQYTIDATPIQIGDKICVLTLLGTVKS